MKRYLFFVNQLYSFEILRPLQEAIRNRGGEVAWFFNKLDNPPLRPDEKQLHTVAEVKQYQPIAVYVPGNWVPDFFPGVKVEVFHGLANDATGKKGHYRIRGLFDLYCTNAPEVTQKFQQLAEEHQHFHVIETGWPKLDPLFREDQIGDLRTQISTDKPIILYASTFSPSLTSAPVLVDTIKALSEKGDYFWLLTLHPKMPKEVVARYQAMAGPNLTFIPSDQGVLPMLKTADAMLCDTSSIALEFMMLDKPLVTYRTKAPGPHLINVTEPGEIEQALAHALSRPPELLRASRDYIDALHPYRDGKSSERILDATDTFINEVAGTLKSKPLNFWRKLQIRKRMAYWRLR